MVGADLRGLIADRKLPVHSDDAARSPPRRTDPVDLAHLGYFVQACSDEAEVAILAKFSRAEVRVRSVRATKGNQLRRVEISED